VPAAPDDGEAGPQAPVRYEIPKEVVAEAFVNAVARRDYRSNGSVQVMLPLRSASRSGTRARSRRR
jgi:hypothetical protein